MFLPAKPGDKIEIRSGTWKGFRGVVRKVLPGHVVVASDTDPEDFFQVRSQDIRNFSAAARKAWSTTPKRAVGRPSGRKSSRISVTLRIDQSLWTLFKQKEHDKLVEDRSAVIERLIAAFINDLERRAL